MSAPICSVMCASDCCSDWASVLSAMNSTPLISASIMRLTALTPPPPTPTTRSCGWRTALVARGAPLVVAGRRRRDLAVGLLGLLGRGHHVAGDLGENALRRRSWGVGVRARRQLGLGRPERRAPRPCAARGPRSPSSGTGRPAALPACSPACRYPFESTSFASRRYDVRRLPVRVVLEDGHPLHGRLRETDGLLDARAEHPVAEVLLEDLDRLLGMQRPRVHHRGQDARDFHVRIQVLADHGEGVLELEEPAHREILALHGDDHLVGRGQRVHRQESQRRRRIDADEVVITANRLAAPCPASARGRSSSTSRSRRRRGRSRPPRCRPRSGG